MLRFIIKREFSPPHCGVAMNSMETIDIDAPELERILCSGGYGPDGYDVHELVGVEIIPAPTAA